MNYKVHPRTQLKVKIEGNIFKTELTKYINEEELWLRFGGKARIYS